MLPERANFENLSIFLKLYLRNFENSNIFLNLHLIETPSLFTKLLTIKSLFT